MGGWGIGKVLCFRRRGGEATSGGFTRRDEGKGCFKGRGRSNFRGVT